MPLKPSIPISPSWPASPTLSDLGDPEWINAYRAAGGHVRTLPSAEDATQAQHLVTRAAHRPGMPTPAFYRLLEGVREKAAAALDPGLGAELGGAQQGGSASLAERMPAPAAPISPPPAAVPSSDFEPDQVLAELQRGAGAWLAIFSPQTNTCMRAAQEAILRGDGESRAHAALSLRRALIALADNVEPAGEGTRPDHTGELRQVGPEQFKNRLYIYLGRRLRSAHQRRLALIELESIERRLSALIRALGKALHSDSDRSELQQVYLCSWSLIAQIVCCAESDA